MTNRDGNGSRKAAQATTPRVSHKNGKDNPTNLINMAEQVLCKIGVPIVCQGNDWWIWEKSGFWKPLEKPDLKFIKLCLLVQPSPPDNKRAKNILDTIRMLNQEEVSWRGAIGFKDSKTVIINVVGGIVRVDLETGKISGDAADPKHYATAQLPVSYEKGAQCPVFESVLETTLTEEADRELIQCFCGYCLLPDTRFQLALYCLGDPNSGKSLLVEHGIGSVFGSLLSAVSLEKMCEGGDELRMLQGSLLNIGNEIDQRTLQSTAIFNKIVCCEVLDAALKYDKAKRIVPTPKHIFIGNHHARWAKGSEAQARRLVTLLFTEHFGEAKKDDILRKEIIEERDGIFQWMLAGLVKLVKRGEMPLGSKASQAANRRFREQNDPIRTFANRYCTRKPEARMFSKDFEKAYRKWARREDHEIGPSTNVIMILKQTFGLKKTPSSIKGQRGYVLYGIQLNEKGAFDYIDEE